METSRWKCTHEFCTQWLLSTRLPCCCLEIRILGGREEPLFQSLGEAKQVWYTGLEQRESNWTHRWETASKPGGEEVELAHGIR